MNNSRKETTKDFIVKLVLIILAEAAFIGMTHVISYAVGIVAHITISYMVAGVILAYLISESYDRHILHKKSRQEEEIQSEVKAIHIEIEVIKLILERKLGISTEELKVRTEQVKHELGELDARTKQKVSGTKTGTPKQRGHHQHN